MTLSHACGHMTFENHSATAHAKLAPNNDCEDLSGICLCEDHFMSVPLVACNLSYSFFIIPNSYTHVYSIGVALPIHYRSHLVRLLLVSRASLPKSNPTDMRLHTYSFWHLNTKEFSPEKHFGSQPFCFKSTT